MAMAGRHAGPPGAPSAGNTFSRSSATRGRIAQVLASARASLQEPSRPVTPLTLDQRTALSFSTNSFPLPEEGLGRYKVSSSSSVKPNILTSASLDAPLTSVAPSQSFPSSSSSVHQDLVRFLFNMEEARPFAFSESEFYQALQQLKACLTTSTRILRAQPSKTVLDGMDEVQARTAALLPLVMSLHVHSDLKQGFLCLMLRLFTLAIHILSPSFSYLAEGHRLFEISDALSRSTFSLIPRNTQAVDRASIAKSLEALPGGVAPSKYAEEMGLLVSVPDVLVEGLAASWKHVQYSLSASPSDSSSSSSSPALLGPTPSIQHALSYAACACALLRIATNDEIERRRLVHTSCLESLCRVLTSFVGSRMIQRWTADEEGGECAQVLVQALAVLRNVTLDKSGRQALLTTFADTTASLCALLSIFGDHADIVLTVARVLAKLSLYEGFRAQMSVADGKSLVYMVRLVQDEGRKCKALMDGQDGDDEWPCWHTWPLVSRICFTLGNLTNSNERNRAVIGMSLDCTQAILLLLQVCASSLCTLTVRRQQEAAKEKQRDVLSVFAFASPYISLEDDAERKKEPSTGEDGGEGELKDAVIKLIRLLANLSIDEQIGGHVGGRHENLQILLELLLICDDSVEQEEMLLNVIAALTNLTYYTSMRVAKMDADSTDKRLVQRVEKTLVTLSRHLSHTLFHENTEIVLETARVLGNLTRRSVVVADLLAQHVHQALMVLLDHSQTEVVSAVLGTLVNVSSHSIGRQGLLVGFGDDGDVVDRLCALLKRLSLQHVQVVVLACQVLYNTLTTADFDAQHLDDHFEVLGEVADSVDIMLDSATVTKGDRGQQTFAEVGGALLDHVRGMLKQ